MVDFSQYYTKGHVSQFITSLFDTLSPITCLELSAGEGALLDAIFERWPRIQCTTVDIDQKNHLLLKSKYPDCEHFCCDATKNDLGSILHKEDDSFDLAVCNPPFQNIPCTESHFDIVEKYIGTEYIPHGATIRSEIVFLAQNIRFLKKGGCLAIIMPELFAMSQTFSPFRRRLVELYHLQALVKCPSSSFDKTDASAYIFFIKKTKPELPQKSIEFFEFEDNSQEKKSRVLPLENFVGKKLKTKNSQHAVVLRGNVSGKQCREKFDLYFHTTSFKRTNNNKVIFDTPSVQHQGLIYAEKDDILIARVGSRVIGNYVEVTKGSAIISDCIFAIRFIQKDSKNIFMEYWSTYGEDWIKNKSRGTCAKHITMGEMYELIDHVIFSYSKPIMQIRIK